ncbi:MAG: hypothetical protein A2X94_07475 [Bdellovibrionales bacterium GWB1_55_8]|nr:MAG: hypothetical protein A2X94_07475 [Bdellovibrionales bacterium GWB1_55_8]
MSSGVENLKSKPANSFALGRFLRLRWERFLEESSFIRHYLWKYRASVGLGLLALVLVDLMEVVPPILLKESLDIAIEGKPLSQLAWIALVYLGVALAQAVGRYGWRIYLIRTGILSGRDLRARFSRHLFGLGASFYDRHRVGNLMSLATSDTDAVRMEIGAGLLVLADAIFYFATVPVAMYLLSPQLMLLAFIPLPIIPWLVIRNEREVHNRSEKVQEALGQLSAMAQEALAGIRVIKGFAKEDVQLGRFRAKGEELAGLSLRLARVQTSFGPTLDFTMSLGLVLLLFVGGKQLIDQPVDAAGAAVTLGTFVAFQRYIQKMVWPMAAIGVALSFYQRAVSSSKRLKAVLNESSDVSDRSEVMAVMPKGAWKTPGGVEFRNLGFRFPGNSIEVLKDVSLRIEPGERVAFIGAIGAGKSALLSLLPRIYAVSDGMLFIDGIDVNRWPVEELRRQVGFVSQDVFLFSETVSENVAFGLCEWMERDSEKAVVEKATQLAAVHDDVVGLISSYRTRLGERGINLSGGQKQRLSIARALVKQPSILVLDDVLSSVDVQTEEKILQGLRSRPGRNTEIVAAHRISTVRDADRIVVLENGTIRQQGTHQQLLADARGAYRIFYEQQQLKEDLEHYAEAVELQT